MLSVARSHFWIEFADPMRDKYEQKATNNDNRLYNVNTVHEDNSADTSGEEASSVTESSNKGRSTSRLPPRSRTGCWTCRRRKVKCDEKHPVCGQCLRLQQVCDYEPHFEFRYDTNKQRAKRNLTGINETHSPPWDRHARRHYDPRAAHLDDMPPFRSLTSEEDRERKAAFHSPGIFHVVADQSSFSCLPEYGGSTLKSSSSAVDRTPSTQYPMQPHQQSSLVDPNVIILDRFENPVDRSPQVFRHQRPNQEQQDDRLSRSHSQPVPALQQAMRDAGAFQQHRQAPRPFYNSPSQTAFHSQRTGTSYGTQYYTAPQLVSPSYPPPAQGFEPPPFRRSYTQTPASTASQYSATPLPSRHLSMSLTSGSGSVLEEISGMRGVLGYTLPPNEESIEDWNEDLYRRTG